MGVQMQAGLASAKKAQLCPWKSQRHGSRRRQGSLPPSAMGWGQVVTSEQTLWELLDPLSQFEGSAQAGRTEQDQY